VIPLWSTFCGTLFFRFQLLVPPGVFGGETRRAGLFYRRLAGTAGGRVGGARGSLVGADAGAIALRFHPFPCVRRGRSGPVRLVAPPLGGRLGFRLEFAQQRYACWPPPLFFPLSLSPPVDVGPGPLRPADVSWGPVRGSRFLQSRGFAFNPPLRVKRSQAARTSLGRFPLGFLPPHVLPRPPRGQDKKCFFGTFPPPCQVAWRPWSGAPRLLPPSRITGPRRRAPASFHNSSKTSRNYASFLTLFFAFSFRNSCPAACFSRPRASLRPLFAGRVRAISFKACNVLRRRRPLGEFVNVFVPPQAVAVHLFFFLVPSSPIATTPPPPHGGQSCSPLRNE